MKKQIAPKTIALALSLLMIASCFLGTMLVATAEGAEPLTFAGWSLTLQNDLSLNYAVDAKYFTEYGYEDPEVTFVMGDRTVTVTEYNTTKYAGHYIFTLTDIAPNQLAETVTATLRATYQGEIVTAEAQEYSVKRYCYNTLAHTDNDTLKTLIVDLLNYGAAAETYVGESDALVNADLTEEQRAFGTQSDATLEKESNAKYVTVSSPFVTWTGTYLTLIDTVEMKFVFNADVIDGLHVKVSTKDPLNAEASGTDYEITDLVPHKDGGWVARFDRFDATQMRDVVYVTVLDRQGNAVSNTYRYSIESYAYAKSNDADANLSALVKAMMKYGNSAERFGA